MKEKITDRFIGKYRRSKVYPPNRRLVIYDTDLTGFCMVVQPTGVISFTLRYRRMSDGATREYNLGKGKASEARKQALKKYGEVRTGIDVQGAKTELKDKSEQERLQTLRVFFEEKYLPYCLSHMRDGEGQAWKIEKYFVREWPDTPLTELNAFRIQNWCREMKKHGLSAGGINRPVSALKAMLNRAVEWQLIESNPLALLKSLKEDDQRPVRYLSEHEETALRAALDAREAQNREKRENYNRWCHQRVQEQLPLLDGVYTDYLKPVVLLALNTGMRRGELFNMQLDDVDLSAGAKKEGRIVVQGSRSKSGNSRFIPLTQEAKIVLKAWTDQTHPDPHGLVFPSPVTGKRFDNINTAWRRLINSAGIQHFRFHDLRHSFASKLAMRSVDLYVIKELLGHASIETTQRYAHLAPEHKSKAIALLDSH